MLHGIERFRGNVGFRPGIFQVTGKRPHLSDQIFRDPEFLELQGAADPENPRLAAFVRLIAEDMIQSRGQGLGGIVQDHRQSTALEEAAGQHILAGAADVLAHAQGEHFVQASFPNFPKSEGPRTCKARR